MTRPHPSEPLARWVERTAVPLLIAFTCGMLAAEYSADRRVEEARAAVLEANAAVGRVLDDLAVWRDGCEAPVAAHPAAPTTSRAGT